MRARLPTVSSVLLCTTVATASLQNSPAQPSGGPDAQTSDFPPLGDIIDRVIERAAAQDESGVEFEYESLIATTTDSFNSDGEVTKTETRLHKRYPLEGELYEELVEQNGHPLSERDRREEREQREKFVREARKRADRGDGPVDTDDERQVRFDRDLFARFDASIVGVEPVRGEPCWVVSFTPRPGKLPENTRIDKALNRSNGSLYVSQQDHGIVRIEFQMREPIRYLWGLIATLRHAEGRLEFERVERDVLLPRTFDFEIDLRIFFRSRRQRIVREWVERRRLDPVLEPGPADPESVATTP